ncbi:MAG: response regulator [Magnetococcus sp. DMHC-8]
MSRVLVVDDDAAIRALLRAFLEEDGHHVEEATDGQQGVRRYQETPVDIVITDVLMPEQDGLELIIELKEMFPEVRIIAMSGGGRGVDAKLGLQLTGFFGVVHQLQKPFTKKQVLEAMHQISHGMDAVFQR